MGHDELSAALALAIDLLVLEGYRPGSPPVTGKERVLPHLLQALVACLGDGVYEGSTWWDWVCHISDIIACPAARDARVQASKGFFARSVKEASCTWLLLMLSHPGSLHAVMREALDVDQMSDLLCAYYTPQAAVFDAEYRNEYLRLLGRLDSMKFALSSADVPLFDVPVVTPWKARKGDADTTQTHIDPAAPAAPLSPVTPVRVKPAEKKKRKKPKPRVVEMEDEGKGPEEEAEEPQHRGEEEARVADRGVQVTEDELGVKADPAEAELADRLLQKEEELRERERVVQEQEAELLAREEAIAKAEHAGAADAYEAIEERRQIRELVGELAALHSRALRVKESSMVLPLDFQMRIRNILEAALGPLEVDGLNRSASDQTHTTSSPSHRGSGVPASPSSSFTGLVTDEVLHVEREAQLAIQSMRCASCEGEFKAKNITSPLRKPRRCHYTGHLYCHKCHTNKEHVLPAKVLHRWDFAKHKVCNEAYSYLSGLYAEPILQVSSLNPRIYTNRRLQVAREKRIALCEALSAIKQFVPDALAGDVYEYLAQDPHVYSLRDLAQINGKDSSIFLGKISKLMARITTLAQRAGPAAVEAVQPFQ
eukprot:Sspe_Gene.24098::Locus_9473_Transcript_1_1_Confidence_1.000_Length_1905::g.24098::m.24098